MEELIVILGPTATGKTKLATHLAYELNAEVISADSRQVYRGMDIGTGKDLADFEVNGKQISYHLIDNKAAGEEYNVFEFQKDFLSVYEQLAKANKKAILCGGTGMYIDSVVKGYRFLQIPENTCLRTVLEEKTNDELVEMLKTYKPEVHNTTDTIDKERIIRAIEIAKFQQENEALIKDFPAINTKIFGIAFDREIIRKRITERLKIRLEEEGMIEEVQRLLDEGVSADRLKFYGLEYKLITEHILGNLSYNDMYQKLNSSIHRFAKRQMTWFRKMEKEGVEINWIDGNLSTEEKVGFIRERLDD